MLINLPVDIFTGIFKIIFPATSLLLMVVIPCPVKMTLLIFAFIPSLVTSLFISEKISVILASITSISSELFIVLVLSSPLYVFSIISVSLSIKDLKASPYCFFSLSASSSDMLNTIAMSFVIVSPPNGIVFV